MRRQNRTHSKLRQNRALPTLQRWQFNKVSAVTPHIEIGRLELTEEELQQDLVHGRA
ncbi:MAG: hypothetical protein GWP91_17980 [Rhodobacterales bacterium]|nr:hypothetical protein [Rhodobacterales bacterium]